MTVQLALYAAANCRLILGVFYPTALQHKCLDVIDRSMDLKFGFYKRITYRLIYWVHTTMIYWVHTKLRFTLNINEFI